MTALINKLYLLYLLYLRRRKRIQERRFWVHPNIEGKIPVLSNQLCKLHTGRITFNEEIFPPSNEPSIPPYEEKFDEPLNTKRARLLFQSRKRAITENGILLSTFAHKYLKEMDEKQLKDYDRLINLPSNDWDIYYWITGVKETPVEFDTKVMKLLKEHVQNKDRESRLRQPDTILSFN